MVALALGVGAVISGEFSAGTSAWAPEGSEASSIAAVIMAVMYFGLFYSIAEMSPALPHTGGAYSFARSAMGPWGGFLTGLAENMEYVITPAVVVGAMGLLMQQIVVGLFNAGGQSRQVSWSAQRGGTASPSGGLFYVIFVGINIVGIEATMRFTVDDHGAVDRGPGVLLPGGDLLREARLLPLDEHLEGRNADPGGGGSWLPFGIGGIFKNLPFAIWFFLAIEEVPLAAEESMDPRRDVPRGSILARTRC